MNIFRTNLIVCLVLFLSALGFLSGCGYGKALQPAEPKGFVDRKNENLTTDKTPFDYAWQDPKSPKLAEIREKGHYKIYISPITTQFLEFDEKDKTLKERVDNVAKYCRDVIVKKIDAYRGKSVNADVVSSREEAEVVVEIAFTEIGFGSPLLYTSSFAAPIPGVATTVDAMHQPVLAIEARAVDAVSGKSISEMADRRIPKIRVFDLNKAVSKTSPLHDICDAWSDEIGRGMQTRLDKEEIKGSGAFTLLPW